MPAAIRLIEGMVFQVVRCGQPVALGVIAGAGLPRRKSKIMYGYFFRPDPGSTSFDSLRPDRAMFQARFGSLRLAEREWPIIGALPTFERGAWHMPRFGRVSALNPDRNAWLITYSDDNPGHAVRVEQVPPPVALQYQPDQIWGADALSEHLAGM